MHHSCSYNNVVVQSNIMDAMTNPDYFTYILKKYAKDQERFVVYVDVYGTVIWDKIMNDATRSHSMGLSKTLLHSMFRSLEVRPSGSEPVTFAFESHPEVALTQFESLLNLVERVLSQDKTSSCP